MPVDFRPPMTDDLCDPALLTVMGDSTIFGRRHLNVGTPEQVMGGDTRASETLSNRNTGTPDEFVPSTCWSWMTITFDRIILVISRHSIPILQCHTTRPHHHSCMQLLDAHTYPAAIMRCKPLARQRPVAHMSKVGGRPACLC